MTKLLLPGKVVYLMCIFEPFYPMTHLTDKDICDVFSLVVFVKEETERGKTSLVRRKNALQGVTTLLVLIMVPNSIINIDG